MNNISDQQGRLEKIREMEKAGCQFVYHASTRDRQCSLTVYWGGWKTTVIRLDVFDFEWAYDEWTEYRDSVAWRVMSHQDEPQTVERAPESPKASKHVTSRAGTPTPNVAKEIAPVKEAVERPRTRRKPRKRVDTPQDHTVARGGEILTPEPGEPKGLSLRDRLKLRNQKGAA